MSDDAELQKEMEELLKRPKAQFVGGPMDGISIVTPDPEYQCTWAVPADDDGMNYHYYVPLTKHDYVRKLSMVYYAYAGTGDEKEPDPETLLDKITMAHPEFPEDVQE
jgi:hypothetical protein